MRQKGKRDNEYKTPTLFGDLEESKLEHRRSDMRSLLHGGSQTSSRSRLFTSWNVLDLALHLRRQRARDRTSPAP